MSSDRLTFDEACKQVCVAFDRLVREIVGNKRAKEIYDLQTAYLSGYNDGLHYKPCNPDIVLSENTETSMRRGTCKPMAYDNGYSMDRVEPGEYYEFWEPACACGSCGELIPMRKFCPNCGCRLEVDA